MTETRWSPAAVRFFEALFLPWMRRRLANICLTGIPRSVPEDHAVILAANHTSWWDAFLLREVHRRCGAPQPLITLMQENQLQRFPFFRWMGVVGVGASIASMRQALRLLRKLRRRGPCWMSVFPQGTIRASWQRPMDFRPGIQMFARELAPAVILPVGIHFEMLAQPAPTAFVAVGDSPVRSSDSDFNLRVVEQGVTARLDLIYEHLAEFGEEAVERWSAVSRHYPSGEDAARSTTVLVS